MEVFFQGCTCYQNVTNVYSDTIQPAQQGLNVSLKIAGADATPNGSQLYLNSPLWVLMVTYR